MLALNRDPEFWREVASHPAVQPCLLTLTPDDLVGLTQNPSVFPFTTAHGGYLLTTLDGVGRGYDLHVMYTPDGWGREAHDACIEVLQHVFQSAQYVTAHEVEENPHSRPPRSFGFVPAGPMWPTNLGQVRTWIVTSYNWWASPAYRRWACHRQ